MGFKLKGTAGDGNTCLYPFALRQGPYFCNKLETASPIHIRTCLGETFPIIGVRLHRQFVVGVVCVSEITQLQTSQHIHIYLY